MESNNLLDFDLESELLELEKQIEILDKEFIKLQKANRTVSRQMITNTMHGIHKTNYYAGMYHQESAINKSGSIKQFIAKKLISVFPNFAGKPKEYIKE